jgi:hypothetical protein
MVFRPTPLRIAGGLVAGSVLAVILWSRHGAEHTLPVRSAAPEIVRVEPHSAPRLPVAQADNSSAPAPAAPAPSARIAIPTHPEAAREEAIHFTIPPIPLIGPSLSSPSRLSKSANATRVAKSDGRPDKPPRARQDSAAPAVQIARGAGNIEERHMAADGDPADKMVKPDVLGPDVDSPSDTHEDTVAMAMPAAVYDEPPTTVSAVSYKPGSLSDKSRNAPPEVQSLYMRTQAAIRRQHEMQQYGGYGRDAYNNIQRGEVGLSLVGGRF